MKNKVKKEIRKKVKDAIDQILSSLNISNPSKKLKKLIRAQTKRLSGGISKDIDKKFKIPKKQTSKVAKKGKVATRSKKAKKS